MTKNRSEAKEGYNLLKPDKTLILNNISLSLIPRDQSPGAGYRVDTHPHTILRFGEQAFLSCRRTLTVSWWGTSPPDPGLFIGQVNSDGALASPVPEAFDPETSSKANGSEAAGRY